MKKKSTKFLSFLLSLTMVVGLLPNAALAVNGTLNGSGTADNPYIVQDEADLKAIPSNANAYYLLADDITVNNFTGFSGNFTGTLDGNGYTLTLAEGTTSSLFPSQMNGTVQNLRIYAPKVRLTSSTQSIMTVNQLKGTVRNCAIIGNLYVGKSSWTRSVSVGAFAGKDSSTSKIENSYAAVSIINDTGDANFPLKAGSIVGESYGGKITNSYYDQSLCANGVGDTDGNVLDTTGLSTAELKTAADKLNANLPEGCKTWKNAENDYPIFAEHTQILKDSFTLSGTAQAGQVLSVEDDSALTGARKYQWYRMDKSGNKTAIDGATEKDYTITSQDVGYQLYATASIEGVLGMQTTDVSAVVASAKNVTVTFNVTPADAAVVVKRTSGYILSSGKQVAELPAESEFTYFVGKDGYKAVSNTFTTTSEDSTVSVSLTESTVSGFTSEGSYNMLTGDLSQMTNFPTSSANANLKWAFEAGLWTNAGGEVSNPVFVDGALYIIGGENKKQHLYKLDTATGKILAKQPITNSGGWNYFLTTGGGMIFYQEGGTVEAFDTDLHSLWVSETVAPGQGLTPIVYSDGFVYGGTCQASGAGFFCLSAADGSLIWFNQAQASNGYAVGSYWAGGCAVGDYILYGTDGGQLYAVNKYSGAIASLIDIYEGNYTKANIRSSVVYDNGHIYFTSTDGYVYMADFDKGTGKVTNLKSALIGEEEETSGFGGTTTGTPVVYGDRLYAGSSKSFGVFDASTLDVIYRTAHTFGTLRNLRLVHDPATGDNYVFTSYYVNKDDAKGSVVMFTDKKGQTESSGYDNFASLTQDYAQYSATSPIFGPDGTIYATNDKGYLFALQLNNNQRTNAIYMTFSDGSGNFVTGADKDKTLLSNAQIYVSDVNGDDKLTIEDAFRLMHVDYCKKGVNGYNSAGGYINRFWGEDTYNISYTLNDKAVDDDDHLLSTDTVIKAGDRINVYLYQDTTGFTDLYTYFDSSSASVKANTAKTFNLKGLAVMSNVAAIPAGATVTVYNANGDVVENLGTTVDKDGNFSITFPSKGRYTVEISGKSTYTGKDWNGNEAVYPDAPVVPSRITVQVTASSSSGGSTGSDTISVKFRLIGATQSKNGVDIANGVDDSKYVTWIATKTYKMDKNSTVADLLADALVDAGLDSEIRNGNWISSITAPEACGGYVLGEYDNGPYSGWMYSVNKIHVQNTIDQQVLKNGDSIIVHYINDYNYEDSQWATGSQGNKDLWDRWLDAPDTNPSKGSSSSGGSSSGSTTETTNTADQKAADDVMTLIKAIGTVTKDSESKITAARAAYNKLTDAQKKLVTNYSTLTAAEQALSRLTGSLPFGDVSGHWAKNAIQYVYENGLFSGISDNEFGPNISMNRAMLVTVLYRLDSQPSVSMNSKFSDVDPAQWYGKAVAWASANGIVSGYSADKFAPTDLVTREQMAAILNRYAKYKGLDVSASNDLSAYTDKNSVSDWALSAMQWANANKLINGRTETTLAPHGNATRAEVAQILMTYAQSK